MADDKLKKDPNYVNTLGAVTNNSAKEVVNLQADSITKRLLVDTLGSRATTLTIYNVVINNADVEQSQALPAGTKKFKIYAMDGNKRYPHGDVLKYTTTSGESGTTFIPIPPAGYDLEEDVNLTSTTLYFQTSTATASPVVIIMCWV